MVGLGLSTHDHGYTLATVPLVVIESLVALTVVARWSRVRETRDVDQVAAELGGHLYWGGRQHVLDWVDAHFGDVPLPEYLIQGATRHTLTTEYEGVPVLLLLRERILLERWSGRDLSSTDTLDVMFACGPVAGDIPTIAPLVGANVTLSRAGIHVSFSRRRPDWAAWENIAAVLSCLDQLRAAASR
jgi:hypothetical protein